MNFLGYAHLFMSMRIYQIKDQSISVDQDIYDNSIVAKYLYNATVSTSTKFYKTTFPSDMIFTKAYAYTSDEKVENLNREFNIHYRACIRSLIYFLFTRVYLSFSVRKIAQFS